MDITSKDPGKNKSSKINGKRGIAGIPARFAGSAANLGDKREQRDKERAQGLLPFACKLPSALTQQLHERGATHPAGLNALVAELLTQALAAKA